MDKRTAAIITTGIVLLGAIIYVTDISFTGFVVQSESIIEQDAEIEVWASSHIKLESQTDSIKATVYLDNGTLVEEQIVNFYIDGYQPPHLKNKSLFNLSGTSPGKYNLKALSRGSADQYINPTTSEKQIEITDQGEVIFLEDGTFEGIEVVENVNETEKEETSVDFEFSETCEVFEEDILWSSGYSNNSMSENYVTWEPNKSCPDCFIGNLELKTRFLSFKETEKQSEGFVQISTQNLESCQNPEQGIYERYIAYETLHGESQKFGRYCGNNKNLNAKCGIEPEDNYESANCYGIKVQSSPRSIVDAFKIKYSLCDGTGGAK